jgi:hypothetical protein
MPPTRLRRRSKIVALVLGVVLSAAVGLVGNYLVNDWTWTLAGVMATLVACLATVSVLTARQQANATSPAPAASPPPATEERQREPGISITVTDGSQLSMRGATVVIGDVDRSVHIHPAGWSLVAAVGLVIGLGVALLGIPLGHNSASPPDGLVSVPSPVSVTTNPDTTNRITTSDIGPGWMSEGPGQTTYGWSWSAPQRPTCTQPFALQATMYDRDAHPTVTTYTRTDTVSEPGGPDTENIQFAEYVWHDRSAAADLRAAIAEPTCRTAPRQVQGFMTTARANLTGMPVDYLAICLWESIPPGHQLQPDGNGHESECWNYVTVGESVIELDYRVNLDLSGDFIHGRQLYVGLSPDTYLANLERLTNIAVNRLGDGSSPSVVALPEAPQFPVYLGSRIEATADTDRTEFSITGTDFKPNTDVYIYFGVQKVAELQAGAGGGFQQTLPVPDSYAGTKFSCDITARSAADNLGSSVLARTACTTTD